MPLSKYDHYNTHYDNRTYRAFRQALEDSAQYGRFSESQTNEDFINTAMNLLIDASFERCGIAGYTDSEMRLMQFIESLDSRVATCARVHLANFGDPSRKPNTQTLNAATQTAQTAATSLSVSQSWRARTAFEWTNAVVHLLHAASAMMTQQDSDALDHVDQALRCLFIGMTEAWEDMTISRSFMAWLRQLVSTGETP